MKQIPIYGKDDRGNPVKMFIVKVEGGKTVLETKNRDRYATVELKELTKQIDIAVS